MNAIIGLTDFRTNININLFTSFSEGIINFPLKRAVAELTDKIASITEEHPAKILIEGDYHIYLRIEE